VPTVPPEVVSAPGSAGEQPAPARERAREGSPLARLASWETLIAFLIVVACIVGSTISGEFLTADSFTTASFDMIEVALMALPLALVVVAAEIDLSIASVLGLSSAVMGKLWNAGLPIEVIFVICLALGALCGAFNGLLVTRLGLPSLAVTIGTLALFRGLAYVVLGDESVTSFPASWTDRAFGTIGGGWFPNVMVLFLILAVIFGILLHFTPFGRSIYAIGANEEAARFSGVRVKRVKLLLFVMSGTVAALVGIVLTLRNSTAAANVGNGFELTVVAAVVLGGVSIFGGRGRLGGVILALVLLGAIQKALTLSESISSYWIQIVDGILLVGSVLIPNLVTRAREYRAHAGTRSRALRPVRAEHPTTRPRQKEEEE
jgi:rhamnose transport system permease protein